MSSIGSPAAAALLHRLGASTPCIASSTMGRRRRRRRRRSRSASRTVPAIAGSEAPVGGHHSIPKSPTPRGTSSTSGKRQRNGGNESTSTLKNSSSPEESTPIIDPSLDNNKEILVLSETPSGFAIFCLKEYYLNQTNAVEDIWVFFGGDFRAQEIVRLKAFQKFKDKTSAINNDTGVSKELTEMILRNHHCHQTLAVGHPEYKSIIERSLPGVPCLFDETVMEVMWGLKNLMHALVPQDELKLTKEDRLPMSQGLKMFLDSHGFDVKPEMVNEDVVVSACLLHDAELIEKRHFKQLTWAADKLKDVSGLNSEGWDMMKIATALKIIFYPVDTTDYDIEMFTSKEISALQMDSYSYDLIFREDISLKIYNEIVEMREVKKDALGMLGSLLS